MERGSELVWGRLAGGPKPIELADDYFKYVVFEDPKNLIVSERHGGPSVHFR